MAAKKKIDDVSISVEQAVDRIYSFCQENKVELSIRPSGVILVDWENEDELGSWDFTEDFKKEYLRELNKNNLIRICSEIADRGDVDDFIGRLKETLSKIK